MLQYKFTVLKLLEVIKKIGVRFSISCSQFVDIANKNHQKMKYGRNSDSHNLDLDFKGSGNLNWEGISKNICTRYRGRRHLYFCCVISKTNISIYNLLNSPIFV